MQLELQASPDFKGIKTRVSISSMLRIWCFKPALISKGLRQPIQRGVGIVDIASSQP